MKDYRERINNDMPRGWIYGKGQPIWHRKVYSMWRGLWGRVYDSQYYFGSLVYPEFIYLSEFVKWIETQPRFDEFCSTCFDIIWCIDKDIIDSSNRNYYPQYMSLITQSENSHERNSRLSDFSYLHSKDTINKSAQSRKRPIMGINIDDGTIIIFNSRNEAKSLGFNTGSISKCLNGIQSSHKGYKWEYIINKED